MASALMLTSIAETWESHSDDLSLGLCARWLNVMSRGGLRCFASPASAPTALHIVHAGAGLIFVGHTYPALASWRWGRGSARRATARSNFYFRLFARGIKFGLRGADPLVQAGDAVT